MLLSEVIVLIIVNKLCCFVRVFNVCVLFKVLVDVFVCIKVSIFVFGCLFIVVCIFLMLIG